MLARTTASILIIDDSPEDRACYKSYLKDRDDFLYTFLETDEAEAGLRLCAEVRFSCILLDYQLPDMSGVEFLQRWREFPDWQRPPVVIVTGRGSEHIAVECFTMGAVDYIIKSNLTSESLFRATRNAIQMARLQAEVGEEQHRREHAELQLRASEERFRLLVESVRDYAIVMLDVAGRVSSWNAGARELLNYHEVEALGQNFSKFFVDEDVIGFLPQHELQLALDNQRAFAERWHVRRDGSRLWASSVLTPVRDATGELRGYSWVLRSISAPSSVSPLTADFTSSAANDVSKCRCKGDNVT